MLYEEGIKMLIKKTLSKYNIHFNARNNAIKFIEDYGSMIHEAKKLAKEQEGTGASKTSRANASERREQSEWNERSE